MALHVKQSFGQSALHVSQLGKLFKTLLSGSIAEPEHETNVAFIEKARRNLDTYIKDSLGEFLPLHILYLKSNT